jgi:hypothetical protein
MRSGPTPLNPFARQDHVEYGRGPLPVSTRSLAKGPIFPGLVRPDVDGQAAQE